MKFSYSIDIACPIEEVFAYVLDFRNCPAWNVKCSEATKETPGPIATGTRFTLVARVMGYRLETGIAIVELIPGQRFTFRSTGARLPFQSSYTFESTGEGTRLSYDGEVNPTGYFRLVAPVIAYGTQKEAPALYGRLKEVLEASGAA